MAIQKRIILCAGHGDGDPGAVAQGTTEANEVIQITEKVAFYLRNSGQFEVHIVPHSLNLVASINWVNARWKGIEDGIAIEIHKNAGGGTGNEVWTPSYPDNTAKKLARDITNGMAATTGLRNRGVKYAQNNRWRRLGWCDDTNVYACLIEAGFIDVDPVHDDMDDKMARGIFKGICDFYGVPSTQKKPVPGFQALAEGKVILRAKLNKTELWDLESNPNYKSVWTYPKGKEFEVTHFIDFGDTRYYVSAQDFKAGKKWGVNQRDVEIAYMPKTTDWQAMDRPRAMVAAKDLRVVDLNKLHATGDLIKAGTKLDFDMKRTVYDVQYLRTTYATGKGLNYGVLLSELAELPKEEKPQPSPEFQNDLEKRVGVLEKIVNGIVEFLSKLFSGFKK